MRDKLNRLLKKLGTTGFFHVLGSSVINKIIGFAGSIVLVRVISKSDYGVYTYADNILSFFLLASGLGASAGVLQMCSETDDPAYRGRLYRYGCRFGLLSNLALAAAVLAIALFVPLRVEGSNGLLALMCLLPLFTLFSELQRTYLRSEMRNQQFSYVNTFNSVATFVLSVGLALLWKAEGLVWAHYLAALLTAGFAIVRYRVPFRIGDVALSAEDRRQMHRISTISMLNNGLSRLMYLLDIFVLGLFIADGSVIASYKIATIIPTALIFVPGSIVTYVYPYFARNRMERGWVMRSYRRLTLYSGLLNGAIALGLFLLAPLILKIVFGAQYLDALVPFRILSVSFAFSGTFRILAGNLLVTQRKLGFNLFVAIFSGALNTILNVIMIRQWASAGAALATLITVVVTSILNTVYFIHTIRAIPDNCPEREE